MHQAFTQLSGAHACFDFNQQIIDTGRVHLELGKLLQVFLQVALLQADELDGLLVVRAVLQGRYSRDLRQGVDAPGAAHDIQLPGQGGVADGVTETQAGDAEKFGHGTQHDGMIAVNDKVF